MTEPTFSIVRKRCRRCLQEKPAAAFHKHAGEADGLQTWCKRCQAVQARLVSASAAVAKAIERQKTVQHRQAHGKACCVCGVVKPLDAFGVDSRKADGRQARCKACAAGPRRQAWTKYNRRRAAAAPVSISANLAPEGDGG